MLLAARSVGAAACSDAGACRLVNGYANRLETVDDLRLVKRPIFGCAKCSRAVGRSITNLRCASLACPVRPG
jgi:hypothetical protein